MRDYGKISTSIWRSKKFKGVSDNDRLFYLYLHTCPHVNSVGCYVLPIGYIQADLGWSEKAINKCIDSLSKAYLIAYNKTEELIRIIGFVDHDPFTNEKHAKGAIKIALSLPDCIEKTNLLNDLASNKWGVCRDEIAKAIDSLSKGYCPEPEPELEPEPECSSKKFDEEDFALATSIYKGVLTVAPKTSKPNLESWANDVRLMREQDGHTLDEIKQVFEFANTDQFWQTNVLSTGKLRKQFSTLHSKMTNGESNATGSNGYQSASDRQQQARQDWERKHCGS